MPAMTPELSVVLAKAAKLNLKTELSDKRTAYIDNRPCQAIKSKWYENFPGCTSMTMYMPRKGFADFLLYVPEGEDVVYVVPRGKIAYDTSWAESTLGPYMEAWHLLKETAPTLFERKVESLSGQLRKIIAETEKRNLPYELIRSKRGASKNDYREYAQRRILIRGKRCAIYAASLLPDCNQAWDGAVFKTPKEDWAEVLLYIVDDDVYVVPREEMPHETSLSLDSTRIYDYKNSWCVAGWGGRNFVAADEGISAAARERKLGEMTEPNRCGQTNPRLGLASPTLSLRVHSPLATLTLLPRSREP